MGFGLDCSVAMCSACSRAVGWVSHQSGFCHPAEAEAVVTQNGFPEEWKTDQIPELCCKGKRTSCAYTSKLTGELCLGFAFQQDYYENCTQIASLS